MKTPKINLLEAGGSGFWAKRRFSFWKMGLLGLAVAAIMIPMFFSVFSLRLLKAASGLNPMQPQSERLSLIDQVRHLVGNNEREMRGEARDRINILLLGEGGEGHDGPHLTDTIVFVSYEPSTKRVGMMSLPRDLWVPLPEGGNQKINSINALAEAAKPGSGGEKARAAVAHVLGQPIDYYIRVDFSAFKTLIDDVGGVTVYVDRTFTDFAYPTDNNLYKKVQFEKGWQTLDGERALEFVRSRHGNNGEGGDFARAARQQKVLLALKEKIVSFDTILNPSRVASILETLHNHVITDMELWEIVKLGKDLRDIDKSKLVRHVIDDGPEGLLYATSIRLGEVDAYALLPRREDWSDVKRMAENVLEERYAPETAKAEPAGPPPAKIEIQNGTRQAGLAKRTQDLLSKVGYDIVKIGNAKEQSQEKTLVYDLTNGGRPEALQTLKNLLGAEVALTLPGYLSSGLTPSSLSLTTPEDKSTGDGVEFLVVLGKNYVN